MQHINATNFGTFVEGLLSLNGILKASFSQETINVILYQLYLLTGLEGDKSLFSFEGSLPTLEFCELY